MPTDTFYEMSNCHGGQCLPDSGAPIADGDPSAIPDDVDDITSEGWATSNSDTGGKGEGSPKNYPDSRSHLWCNRQDSSSRHSS